MSSWIKNWNPEDEIFWESTGKKIAWNTLTITTISLVMSFATWFLFSVMVIKLPVIGFSFTKMQLFWLAAMPGLAGGLFRILHTFLIPMFGTRLVVTVATLIKIIPLLMLGFAVSDPNSSFGYFMVIAFLMGMGGGDFSSFMPSTSTFFPKRLIGTALGIQAGIGNFGVSLVQLISPILLGVSIVAVWGGGQTVVDSGQVIYLQNIAFFYVIPLFIMGIISWIKLRSVPVVASFKEQLDIFGSKHTWYCTLTYFMTFGTFAGMSAAFPLLIRILYGEFPEAPDPLKYAFYGPLIGSAVRVVFGKIADKTGGAILTQITGIAIVSCIALMIFMGVLTPTSMEQFPWFVGLVMVIFFFTGVGNAATFRQFPIIFSDSPRKAAGVIGWTAAVAAFGPFIYNILIGQSIEITGTAIPFFSLIGIISVWATWTNWYYYTRKGCERPS
ncbi:MFS transporter [Flavobacterium sp. UBA6135]|uniref:MFS transporter n=1 Tax=Flavobacterium sp. UBA6135 TaxID=1946553 RepID=UPI0025C02265|nr:MFS transporter [Flavobacterium sp. UBA6135]